MTPLQARFAHVIGEVLDATPDPSPEMLAYFDHIRLHAELSRRCDEEGTDQAFEQWLTSIEDDRTWNDLSDAERALLQSYF